MLSFPPSHPVCFCFHIFYFYICDKFHNAFLLFSRIFEWHFTLNRLLVLLLRCDPRTSVLKAPAGQGTFLQLVEESLSSHFMYHCQLFSLCLPSHAFLGCVQPRLMQAELGVQQRLKDTASRLLEVFSIAPSSLERFLAFSSCLIFPGL